MLFQSVPAGTIVYEMPQAKIQKPTQSTSQDDPNRDLPNPHPNHEPTETSARRSKDNGEFPFPNHRSSSKSSTHRVNTKTVPKITSVVSLQPRGASEYLYNCSNCPSQFNSKQAARLHTKNCSNSPNLHGSKTPKLKKLINCQFCGRSFPTIHQVRSHERVHTKDRPFSCYVCAVKFAHGGNLVKHIKAMHRGYNSYICRYCLQTFKTHVELQDHRKVCELYHKDCEQRRSTRTRYDSLDSAGQNISEDTDTASEPDDDNDNSKPARTFRAARNSVPNAIRKKQIVLICENRT